MATTVNNYSKGMNKDVHPLKMTPDTYEEMYNLKVLTDKGSSFGAIVNERGNRLDFCIPSTQAVYALNTEYVGPSLPIIGLNGQGYIFVDDITLLTTQQIYERLINNPAYAAAIENGDYNFYISGGRLVLVGLENLTLLDNANIFVQEVAPIEQPLIIGWTNMDDKIIIFTTGNTTSNPTNSDGQIWAIDYDESTDTIPNLVDNCLVPSIHLKYNNCLNLSTEHSVTRALTRYETIDIARVYWTDYLNPLRSFNLFNPQGFAIACNDLDLSSDVSFGKAVFTNISTGGGIPTGSTVQVGYRLLGNSKVTNVSPLTNPLPIYSSDDENDLFREIKGSPQSDTDDNKSVTFSVSNIDTSYNFIEYIYIINEFENLPLVYSNIETIPSTGIITKTFTNTENDLTTLSDIEINTLVPEINVVKDIAIKDNRLIAANHKLRQFEITDEEFDARAYRFKSDSTATVYQSDGTATVIPNDLTLDAEHDAINPYNNTNDLNFDEYIYKSDGTTLGGEGINVTYNFFTKDLLGDQRGQSGSTPWCGTLTKVTYEDNFQTSITHFVNNQFNNYVSPFVHNLFTGYQRDEVYRFAIVFRSKKGELSFTKWIGDIKFPTLKQLKLSSGQTTDTNPLNLKVLAINFDITIPESIKEKIDGYEIVRVERKNSDRSRIGGGALQHLILDGLDVKVNEDVLSGSLLNSPSVSDEEDNYFVGYTSPETLFNTSLTYKTGDYLKIEKAYNNRVDSTISSSPDLRYIKMHTSFNVPDVYTVPVLGWRKVASDNAINVSSLEPTTTLSDFKNKVRGLIDGTQADYSCGQTTFMQIGSPISEVGLSDSSRYLVYATYCRDITNQYGGNTFESRSSNQYMSTGSLNPSNESGSMNIYGGDTFVHYFMYEQVNEVDLGTYSDKASTGVGFPCESTFNVELRHGNHFSKDRGAPDGTGTSEDPYQTYGVEQFAINAVYTQENNISSLYQGKNFLANTVTELPYSVWSSEPKTNGEFIDSFNAFLVNNQIDVDGNYGPINSIHNFKDKIFFYQNSGFGIVPINERVTAPDENGTSLIIGDGQVLGDYAYISTHTGCFHRTAVIHSEDNIYHFDIRQKKLWRYSLQSKFPLSDVKGMSAYLSNTFDETPLENTDNPTSNDIPYNIHGAYDHRYNRVLFTVLSSENSIQQVGDRPLLKNTTFSYNEIIDAFESFYDFKPKLYLSTGRKLLSVDSTDSKVYQHDKGNYGVYYDSQPYSSSIKYLINGGNHMSKQWNNLEWNTDVYDTNNLDVYDDTFDFIRVSNNYQDTNTTALIVPDNTRQRFRIWRHSILRNSDDTQSNDRIRNPWIRAELRYNNDNNYRFVMNDLVTHYHQQPINNY
jgi:hypothetical protein